MLANVAREIIAKEGHILAFDEVQLVDAAGAAIFKSVLSYFWRLGGVVIATSNRLPSVRGAH